MRESNSGDGWVGKTILAQGLFNEDEVGKHFDLKEWICVYEEFDVFKVTKTILREARVSNIMDLNLLQVELKKRLAGKKFLIVLDDVWNDSYDDWNVLKKPFNDGAQGSKIIHASSAINVDIATNYDLEKIGTEIVKKCKGLSLAAKTLGGLLHSIRVYALKERDVLDNLLPNTNLKKLKIEEYGGTTFPKWFGNQTLCNLVELSLEHCNFCHILPSLGKLPSLNSLRIGYFDAVVKVGLEFYGCSVKPSASLESLVFDRMYNWKEWLMPIEDVEAFPKLKTLKLAFCGSLNGNLPCFLPSLKELSILCCSEHASSLPKMPLVNTLHLQCFPRLMGFQDIETFSCLQELKSLPVFWPNNI
ncbi:NB-ARC domain, LRR domain containing protein [Parasponia andersonii]|uniref:NB-ARC domain, LRR domain containing protein n=1 Tax=Parasponia andersonii TaxID=3476 RepID=A0A2P5AD33_PARAD|nr:NB-ARC domain, LRR domain containing protein [Parasponia andersonii]